MSRFGNLEFEDESSSRSEPKPLVKDEQFYFHQAEQAFHRGQFERALRHYSKVLEFNPNNAQAWVGQVRMLIELGEYAEARTWAEKALNLAPDEPELLAAKGVALARLGDLQGAISFCDAAVEARGNTPYVWLARGDVLLARKEKRAEYCFDRALGLAANHWLVLWLAARIQAFYEHFALGLKLARHALTLEPDRAVLWIEVGRCELALGLPEQAQRAFEQARELDPECDTSALQRTAENTGFLDKTLRRWRQWWRK